MRFFILAALALFVFTSISQGQEKPAGDIDGFIELLRTDLREAKREKLEAAMDLNEIDSKAFWKIYDQYDVENKKLLDKSFALIKEYGEKYKDINNDLADKLNKRAFKLERAGVDLRWKYYKKVKKAISPIVAARFVQAENQLGILITLQISSQLPLIK